MANDFFSDITSSVLAKTLDATAARQKAIANNIANVETPGYKRVYVSFENELKSIMEQGSGRSRREALKALTPVRHTDELSPAKPDGNNVNIDGEIADLAKNALDQKATAVLLEAKISMLRAAILGGKG